MTPSTLVSLSSSRCSGRLRLLDRRQQRGDVADLRGHARRGDQQRAGAARHGRVLERHVGAVAERDLLVGERDHVLADRGALAGQRGFLRLHRGGPQQPAVGGHDVAGLQLDDVAGHQVVRGDLHQRAVPPDPGLRFLHRGQRVDALAREHLLAGADDDVDHHQEADDEGRRPLPDGRAHRRDGDQHDVHRVPQLLEDHRPHGRCRLRGQGVGAVPLPAGGDLGGGQAGGGVGVELRGRSFRVEGPPARGGEGGGLGCSDLRHVCSWAASVPSGGPWSDAIPRCPDRGRSGHLACDGQATGTGTCSGAGCGSGCLLERAGPPHRLADVEVQGRDQHGPDHEGVQQHPERHGEPDLRERHQGQRAEHRERPREHQAGRRDHPARRRQAHQRAAVVPERGSPPPGPGS